MRGGLRYPGDLRDGKWALIEPQFPAARRGDRPRPTCQRAVMEAILSIASSGCAWRMLPKCFPPVSTVRGYFHAWRDSGLLTMINHLLAMTARQQAGREASPTADVVERTFAWLGRRRLAKDRERSTAWATTASIRMLTRGIARLSTQSLSQKRKVAQYPEQRHRSRLPVRRTPQAALAKIPTSMPETRGLLSRHAAARQSYLDGRARPAR